MVKDLTKRGCLTPGVLWVVALTGFALVSTTTVDGREQRLESDPTPEGIEEVRRILLEHAGASEGHQP
jgi:hypothetical protein